MEEVDDRELVVERVAALDLGKAGLEACVRVPHPAWPGRHAELRGTAPPPRNWWRWRPGYGIGMWPG